jgi:hypothetical protein
MATTAVNRDADARADEHAKEAERLLKTSWLTSHIKAQAHATLAVYYATKRGDGE